MVVAATVVLLVVAGRVAIIAATIVMLVVAKTLVVVAATVVLLVAAKTLVVVAVLLLGVAVTLVEMFVESKKKAGCSDDVDTTLT